MLHVKSVYKKVIGHTNARIPANMFIERQDQLN